MDNRRHAFPRLSLSVDMLGVDLLNLANCSQGLSWNNSVVKRTVNGYPYGVKILANGLHKNMPGGTIDAWCGKCKLLLAHTIEAMVGDKPQRVVCNTCRSQHGYKAQAPGTPRQSSRTGKRVGNSYQSLLKAKEAEVARTYSPTSTYAQGDFLEHPTFGRGVATAVKDGAKIEVLFESGSKTLIHGR
jgi:hypothetical protein